MRLSLRGAVRPNNPGGFGLFLVPSEAPCWSSGGAEEPLPVRGSPAFPQPLREGEGDGLRPLRREGRCSGSELPPRRGMSGRQAQKPLGCRLGSCGLQGRDALSLRPRGAEAPPARAPAGALRPELCSGGQSVAVLCPRACPRCFCGRSGRSQPAAGLPEPACLGLLPPVAAPSWRLARRAADRPCAPSAGH